MLKEGHACDALSCYKLCTLLQYQQRRRLNLYVIASQTPLGTHMTLVSSKTLSLCHGLLRELQEMV